VRLLLTVLVPLLLPSILYFAYVAVAREGPRGTQSAPWFWLAGTGVLLAIGALVLLSGLGGAEPGSVYHPPRQVDGRIEPGYFGPKKEPPSQ